MYRLPITTYPLDEIIALARQNSPYFQQSYAHLPERPALTDLPVLDAKSYWEAHARHPREILTSEPLDGAVLNTGGSTGLPKFSYYNDVEMDSAVALTARSMEGTGLRDGDQVANLFGAGYLYASLMVAMSALKETPAKVLQLPIGHLTPPPDAIRLMRCFRVNVWAGITTHMMNLVDYLQKQKIDDIPLTRIIYAGEPCTTDQRRYLEGIFPGIEIRSLSYASVDGGVIGLTTADCGPGEHRIPDGAVIMEILDEETGGVVEAPGQPGTVVFTNLTRRLMPTLRYPTGDRAQWVEDAGSPARKFLLLGRSEESARVSNFNVPVEEVAKLLEPFRVPLQIQQFQLVITQEELRDCLTMRLASHVPQETLRPRGQDILDSLFQQKPFMAELIAKGLIRPVRIEWIEPAQLEVNPRTGKVRMVIDRRLD